MNLYELKDRDDFPAWLNRNGLVGKGVEVGVFEACYSAQILTGWKGQKLIGIDPFRNYPEDIYRDGCNKADLEKMYGQTMERMKNEGRYELRRMESIAAMNDFPVNTLDFVYIDGNHRYEQATADLRGWWTRVKSGGIVGLHDFYTRDDDGQLGNVARAVWEFAYEQKLSFLVTPCTTAWFIKP